MEQYSYEEFESFMKAMKTMSDILHSNKPDYIFAPVIGSVPLIDTLSVIDRHFPMENVEFPPNSSRFINREEFIDKWYTKFIKSNYGGDKIFIICIDEIISGSSAVKGYKEFRKILHELNDGRLEKRISYNILGIGETPKYGKRTHSFSKLVNQNKAKVLEVKRIITSDNPNLNPIRLKFGEINRQGRQTYLPEIESFNYSQDYLNFLQNVANYVGADPEKISLNSLGKIKESISKYLR